MWYNVSKGRKRRARHGEPPSSNPARAIAVPSNRITGFAAGDHSALATIIVWHGRLGRASCSLHVPVVVAPFALSCYVVARASAIKAPTTKDIKVHGRLSDRAPS